MIFIHVLKIPYDSMLLLLRVHNQFRRDSRETARQIFFFVIQLFCLSSTFYETMFLLFFKDYNAFQYNLAPRKLFTNIFPLHL